VNANALAPGSNQARAGGIFLVLVRWLLGGLFLYLGLSKALHPVEFLKLVRQYNLFHDPLLLNFVASTLPWFEIFCGLLLLVGVAVRGAAVMLVAMLIPFTIVVFLRALEIHETSRLAFCAIKFDCGCGAGEVLICRKLAENALLTVASVALIFQHRQRLCLRHSFFKTASSHEPL
jgi:uncharacterized membrane protein YphA (DoxX/SURF4 family)